MKVTKKYSDQIYTFRDSKKRYVLPKNISKGNALAFVLNNMNYDILIVAGDNEADISMLNLADIAIVPSPVLARRLCAPHIICCNSEEKFAERIAEVIIQKVFENIIDESYSGRSDKWG
jgi:hydroxymethylpyrimidine pyrophosphatase-like HAD family hydrolase